MFKKIELYIMAGKNVTHTCVKIWRLELVFRTDRAQLNPFYAK